MEETLKNGAAGSATLRIMSCLSVPNADCARRMVIGPRTVRRTSEIKKQTEIRMVESSGDGRRGSSLREPLKREVKISLMYILLSAIKKKLAFLCVILNLNYENSDKSLMMYKREAFKKILRYPMFVEGVMIEFLADSGASRSCLRPCDLPWVLKDCVDATDWCEIRAGVKHSESLGAFMSQCKHEIEVESEVVYIDKNTKGNHCMADICVSEIHPALADVPSELWSRHKYVIMWD